MRGKLIMGKVLLEAGHKILALDERNEYIIDSIWPVGASLTIDFTASQVKSIGFDQHGNTVHSGRGFTFKDEGIKWIKL
jgi:hypothetical protein